MPCLFGHAHARTENAVAAVKVPDFISSAGDMPEGRTGLTTRAPNFFSSSDMAILDGLSAGLQQVGTLVYQEAQLLW